MKLELWYAPRPYGAILNLTSTPIKIYKCTRLGVVMGRAKYNYSPEFFSYGPSRNGEREVKKLRQLEIELDEAMIRLEDCDGMDPFEVLSMFAQAMDQSFEEILENDYFLQLVHVTQSNPEETLTILHRIVNLDSQIAEIS